MPSTTSRNERTSKRKTSQRRPLLSFEDHVLDLRNDNPEIFENYDPHAIARALLTKGVLNHENVMLELAEANVQTFRRKFDPNFDMVTSQRPQKITPKTKQIAAAVLGSFKPDTIMRDGRQLREWTWGEFRTEFKGMSQIMSRFAHLPDDELIGDTL